MALAQLVTTIATGLLTLGGVQWLFYRERDARRQEQWTATQEAMLLRVADAVTAWRNAIVELLTRSTVGHGGVKQDPVYANRVSQLANDAQVLAASIDDDSLRKQVEAALNSTAIEGPFGSFDDLNSAWAPKRETINDAIKAIHTERRRISRQVK